MRARRAAHDLLRHCRVSPARSRAPVSSRRPGKGGGFARTELSPAGSPLSRYLAPELLDGRAYGAQVDWWAFGALLYEMLCGRTPFFDRNRRAMFRAILTAPPRFDAAAGGGPRAAAAPFSPAAVALLSLIHI